MNFVAAGLLVGSLLATEIRHWRFGWQIIWFKKTSHLVEKMDHLDENIQDLQTLGLGHIKMFGMCDLFTRFCKIFVFLKCN